MKYEKLLYEVVTKKLLVFLFQDDKKCMHLSSFLKILLQKLANLPTTSNKKS